MKKTEQQIDIIETAKVSDRLLINAVAGSGKTSTLAMVSEELGLNTLLLVFNKSAQLDAEKRFPSNVETRTTHSMAYRAIGCNYQAKLTRPRGSYVNVAATGSEIAKYFNIKPMKGKKDKLLSAAYIGLLAKDTVGKYESSADKTITRDHLVSLREAKERYGVDVGKLSDKVLEIARKLWKERIDISSDVMITHDTYMKMWQLSNPVLEYDMILLDEAQDTTDCVLDVFQNQTKAKLISVGDERQAIYCQPAGTKIKVVDEGGVISEVNIENLQEGDRVLSYNLEKHHLHKMGKSITKFGCRSYTGGMVEVSVLGVGDTKYTADHEVIVKLGHHNDNKYVHYLMKRGDKYRTGIVPWQSQMKGVFGMSQRCTSEGADSAWIIGLYGTREEAVINEAIFSYQYKIPDNCFDIRKVSWADKFWGKFKHDSKLLERMWEDTKLNRDEPLWCPSKGPLTFRGAVVTKASNVVEGMLMCDLTDRVESHGKIPKDRWKPISNVSKYHVEQENVYSMEVADNHTYVGDNILTHNCWRNAINAMKKLDWPVKPLTVSFRYGQDVADLASKILGDVDITSHEGTHTDIGEVDRSKPYTILYRTNSNLVMDAVKEIRKGKSVKLEMDTSGFCRKLESCEALYRGDKRKVKHEDILAFETWDDLTTEAKKDPELSRIAGIVEAGNVQYVIDSLNSHRNSSNAICTMTTAHKSKGREWDQVVLANDFPSNFKKGKWVGLEEGEQNLLYVAATRGKKVLEPNSTIEEYSYYRGYDSEGIPVGCNMAVLSGNTSKQEVEHVFKKMVNSFSSDHRLDAYESYLTSDESEWEGEPHLLPIVKNMTFPYN